VFCYTFLQGGEEGPTGGARPPTVGLDSLVEIGFLILENWWDSGVEGPWVGALPPDSAGGPGVELSPSEGRLAL